MPLLALSNHSSYRLVDKIAYYAYVLRMKIMYMYSVFSRVLARIFSMVHADYWDNSFCFCTGASSTFVSYDNTNESFIDHILLPIEQLHCVLLCEICDDEALNVSRHRPVVCQVRVPTQYSEYAMSNPVSDSGIINLKKGRRGYYTKI